MIPAVEVHVFGGVSKHVVAIVTAEHGPAPDTDLTLATDRNHLVLLVHQLHLECIVDRLRPSVKGLFFVLQQVKYHKNC